MKIENIEQLKAEKLKLQQRIDATKLKLATDLMVLQKEIEPVRNMMDVSKNLFVESNRNNSLISFGLNVGVDALLRNTLLRNASWLTRLAVPFVTKNLLSNYIANRQEKEFPQTIKQIVSTPRTWLVKSLLWIKDVTSEKTLASSYADVQENPLSSQTTS